MDKIDRIFHHVVGIKNGIDETVKIIHNRLQALERRYIESNRAPLPPLLPLADLHMINDDNIVSHVERIEDLCHQMAAKYDGLLMLVTSLQNSYTNDRQKLASIEEAAVALQRHRDTVKRVEKRKFNTLDLPLSSTYVIERPLDDEKRHASYSVKGTVLTLYRDVAIFSVIIDKGSRLAISCDDGALKVLVTHVPNSTHDHMRVAIQVKKKPFKHAPFLMIQSLNEKDLYEVRYSSDV